MTSQTFRFDAHQFQSRMRSAFEPRKPRHPLARFALGLLGLAVLAALVVFGAVVGAAMLVAGVVYKLTLGRRKTARPQDASIVEAEYRVVAPGMATRDKLSR